MGNPAKTEQSLHLLLDVARTQDGRIEGRMRTAPGDPGLPFSGVLELLRVLEDLIDRDQSESGQAAAPESDIR
jgi:hypothetical protein